MRWSDARAVALMLAAFVLLAPSRAGAEEPAHHRSKGKWSFDLSTRVQYDDNVLELSNKESKRVGDPAFANRYRITTVGDTIVLPRLQASWERNLAKQRATMVTMAFAPSYYLTNDYLSQNRWSLDVEQELGRDRRATMNRIGVAFDYVPQTMLRKLKDDDVSLQLGRTVRVDGQYESVKSRLFGTIEIWKRRMALDLGLDWEDRDWIPTFHERSGELGSYDLRLAGYAGAKRHWRFRLGWRHELYDGVGDDPATPLVEDDISSKRYITTADARYMWGKSGRAQRAWAVLETERRDYTAKSPFDFYHHARHDHRFGWEAGWRMDLPHDLQVQASISGDGNRSTFTVPPPPTITPEEGTDYDKTVIEAGLTWSFTGRSLKGKKAPAKP